MTKRLKPSLRKILWATFVLMLTAIVVGGVWLYEEYTYRFSPVVAKAGSLYVHAGQTFDQVIFALEAEGFVKNSQKLKQRAVKYGLDTAQIGHYRLEHEMTSRTLLTQIARGRQTPVRVTFNNIRTLEQLAERVSRSLSIEQKELEQHFRAEATESGEKENYIARFLPDTYHCYWTMTPAQFTASMKQYQEKFWSRNDRIAKAKKLGLTPNQATIIASIVIEETKMADEMTTVAGVYINRLAKGMPLQADPTVKYAVGDFSIRRVLNKHTQYDSPYNTYVYRGLPPGPICAPEGSVIDSVLAYNEARHSWLYFCASPAFDGRHSFATNLSDHNRNAAAYHQALNTRGIR